ncbi:MAG: hypothetical protein LBP61_01625 [Desulfovibrio sp.]|jgi:hypothetical protein|nr:hypothetical protein [Desulfovibrio sp.]
MADRRKKSHSILLSVNGKKTSVELFPAEEWPDQPGGDDLYRARIDGRWHGPSGTYSFLTLAAVGALVSRLLAGGVPVSSPPPLGLERCRRVKVAHGDCLQGVPVRSSLGWTLAPAHQGADGRYWVWVNIGDGPALVPADNVEIAGR